MNSSRVSQHVREAIAAGNASFVAAIGRHDPAAAASLYTRDGEVLPAGSEAIQGRPAIEQFWRGALDMGIKGARLESVEVDGTDDCAYEVGRYTMNGEADQQLDTGKYVVIWKTEDGQLKIHRDIWTTNLQAPAPAGR